MHVYTDHLWARPLKETRKVFGETLALARLILTMSLMQERYILINVQEMINLIYENWNFNLAVGQLWSFQYMIKININSENTMIGILFQNTVKIHRFAFSVLTYPLSIYKLDNYKIENSSGDIMKNSIYPPSKLFFLFSTTVPQPRTLHFSFLKTIHARISFVLHFLTIHHTLRSLICICAFS